jgi:serine/threonine protein kinase
MKHICLRCNRTSVDKNLWCQEKYCPAENATEIFDNGEWFGDIEIIEPLAILRSSIIYKAQRGEQKIFLKVANNGCEEKLRREASAFLQLAQHKQHPLLPVILSAHVQGMVANYPFGWIVIGGAVKYYSVFSFVEGDILRHILLKNPQPWYQNAGWIIVSIADVIYYLHSAGKLHLCLSPEVILVRFDKQGIPRPMLLDLGVGDNGQDIQSRWNNSFTPAAYTAPEILEPGAQVSQASDVYGLGLILYEMLAGHPAFKYNLIKDETVQAAVLAGSVLPTGRRDLKNIPEITEKAIARNIAARQPNVLTFAREIQANLPVVPREKKSFKVNWRNVLIVAATLLLISLLLAFFAIGQ